MNSDASECRHPKSQFSGSKVIVSGQKMGTSLSSRHGHSFVQKHILGSQKKASYLLKKTHFGGPEMGPFWGPEMGPFLGP